MEVQARFQTTFSDRIGRLPVYTDVFLFLVVGRPRHTESADRSNDDLVFAANHWHSSTAASGVHQRVVELQAQQRSRSSSQSSASGQLSYSSAQPPPSGEPSRTSSPSGSHASENSESSTTHSEMSADTYSEAEQERNDETSGPYSARTVSFKFTEEEPWQ